DRCRPLDIEPEPAGRDGRGHEEDEESAHAVVAEALPELREEEGRQPPGVPGDAAAVEVREAHRGREAHGGSARLQARLQRGTMARTRAGAPEPRLIFIGATMIVKPLAG